MTCPTCGRQVGACRHTTEGQVTTERPLSRGMRVLLGTDRFPRDPQDPTRPQPTDAPPVHASSLSAAGGADEILHYRIGLVRVLLEDGLRMLSTGDDGHGNRFDDLRLRIAYTEKSIEICLRDLPRAV